MLLVSFFQWWYGTGWKWYLRSIKQKVQNIAELFSIEILSRTLFAPWKQIISYASADQSLGNKLRAVLDNLVSRFVGFWVRLFALITAALAVLAVTGAGVVLAFMWPLIPVAPFILIAMWFAGT